MLYDAAACNLLAFDNQLIGLPILRHLIYAARIESALRILVVHGFEFAQISFPIFHLIRDPV